MIGVVVVCVVAYMTVADIDVADVLWCSCSSGCCVVCLVVFV